MTDMTFDAMEEAAPGPSPVSTGHLPAAERVQAWVEAAYERFKSDDSGRNADHYPALAEVPRDLLGVCVAGTDGAIAGAGDIAYPYHHHERGGPIVHGYPLCYPFWSLPVAHLKTVTIARPNTRAAHSRPRVHGVLAWVAPDRARRGRWLGTSGLSWDGERIMRE